MRPDDAGDVGFLEAMVALTAVVTVLLIFLAAIGQVAAVEGDPLQDFDWDRVRYSPMTGEFDAETQAYLQHYLTVSRASGLLLTAYALGSDDQEARLAAGELNDVSSSRRKVSLEPAESGRVLPVVYGVSACARTTADSWRWWTPWYSSPSSCLPSGC
jgi:hypothetical protein